MFDSNYFVLLLLRNQVQLKRNQPSEQAMDAYQSIDICIYLCIYLYTKYVWLRLKSLVVLWSYITVNCAKLV